MCYNRGAFLDDWTTMKKSFLAILLLMFFASTAESEEAVVSDIAANKYRIDGTSRVISTINCPIKARHTPVTLTSRTGFIRITFLQTANKIWCDAAVSWTPPNVQQVILINRPRTKDARLRRGMHDQAYPVRYGKPQRQRLRFRQNPGMALTGHKPARQQIIFVIKR